jgi:hypothetical protein
VGRPGNALDSRTLPEDALGDMRPSWVVLAVGVVLVASATILGLLLFRTDGLFEITPSDLAIWSIVVGVQIAAFLALLFAQMTAPSVKRRSASFLFGLFGGVCGLVAGLVLGIVGIEVVCGGEMQDSLGCRLSLLWAGWGQDPWPALGRVVGLAVILGMVGGVTAAWLRRGRHASVNAMSDVR